MQTNQTRSVQPTAGIILAAGSSTRMGRPKQLVHIGGDRLLNHVLKAAIASGLETLIIVLGHEARAIQAALETDVSHPGVRVVVNDRYREGMATSLQAGLAAVQAAYPAVMILLGDQPFVDTATINHLLEKFWQSPLNICVPVRDGKRGLPVCFGRPFYDTLMRVSGDQGGREIIRDHPEQVLQVDIDNPDCFFDIDDEQDLAAGRKRALD